ncbi:MAG: calcium/sodium antiporter [Lachnospiraceae bacterium]
MVYIILLIGFILLIKGADFFVDGSSSVAKRLHVPVIIIGMTIVAMGTSLPEAAVSVSAAISGNNDLAIANAVGSNIFNLMVVAGICSIFTPLTVHANTLKKEFPLSVLAALLLLILGITGYCLTRLEGLILLTVFACFLIWMIKSAIKAKNIVVVAEEDEITVLSKSKSMVYILCGVIAIAVGGQLVVSSASSIARSFGLSQNLIGLTIVAMGTSLPELVTSIVAAKKGEVDLAMGNIIGSNIFNILFVIGSAGLISGISMSQENIIDLLLLIAMSIVVWIAARTSYKIHRTEGIVMLLLYVGFMAYIILR